MSYEPMSIHPNHVEGYRAAGFTVNYPKDLAKAEEKSSIPWSEPGADPGKDMREVWEKSREAYLSR